MATGDADSKCSYSMRFVYPEGLLGRLIAIKSAEIKGRRVGQQANITTCVPQNANAIKRQKKQIGQFGTYELSISQPAFSTQLSKLCLQT
jgi:hypothetical protein